MACRITVVSPSPSPSPFPLDFGFLDLELGFGTRLGLDNYFKGIFSVVKFVNANEIDVRLECKV